jgi:hypothetical protein
MSEAAARALYHLATYADRISEQSRLCRVKTRLVSLTCGFWARFKRRIGTR